MEGTLLSIFSCLRQWKNTAHELQNRDALLVIKSKTGDQTESERTNITNARNKRLKGQLPGLVGGIGPNKYTQVFSMYRHLEESSLTAMFTQKPLKMRKVGGPERNHNTFRQFETKSSEVRKVIEERQNIRKITKKMRNNHPNVIKEVQS